MQRPTFTSFDVADDARRAEVRSVLRVHGDWVQRSLWLAIPSPQLLVPSLGERLEAVLAPSDRLLIHRPCLTCLSRIRWRPVTDRAVDHHERHLYLV